MYYDFEARAKFLSFFIPSSLNFYDACKDVAQNTEQIIKDAETGVEVQGGRLGELGMTNGRDISFSGRVYIYHEMPMTTTEVYELLTIAKQHKLDLMFRSYEYIRGRER